MENEEYTKQLSELVGSARDLVEGYIYLMNSSYIEQNMMDQLVRLFFRQYVGKIYIEKVREIMKPRMSGQAKTPELLNEISYKLRFRVAEYSWIAGGDPTSDFLESKETIPDRSYFLKAKLDCYKEFLHTMQDNLVNARKLTDDHDKQNRIAWLKTICNGQEYDEAMSTVREIAKQLRFFDPNFNDGFELRLNLVAGCLTFLDKQIKKGTEIAKVLEEIYKELNIKSDGTTV